MPNNKAAARAPRGPRLSPAEEARRERALDDAGNHIPSAAAALGLKASTLSMWALSRGLRPRPRRSGPRNVNGGRGWRYSRPEHDARLRLHKQGMNDGEIARERGVTKQAISLWRQRYGLAASTRRKKEP